MTLCRALLRAACVCLLTCGTSAHLASCAAPETLLRDLVPGASQQAAVPPAEQPAAPASDDTSAPQPPQRTIKEAIDVRSAATQVARAQRALTHQFRGFLSQRPLGFDQNLFGSIRRETERAWVTLQYALRAPEVLAWTEVIAGLVPLLVIILAVIIFTLLDRQFTRWALAGQARMRSRLSPWFTLAWRSVSMIIARIASPMVIVVLSYFPVRAIFGATSWTLILGDAFWLLAGYRLIQSVLESFVGLPWLMYVQDGAARGLRAALLVSARLAIASLALGAAVRAFDMPPDLDAFAIFCVRLGIALLPAALIGQRANVVALFHAHDQPQIRSSLRRAIARAYYWVVVSTMGLLALRAFGYQRAATFILERGYGLLALGIGTLLVVAWARELFSRQIGALEPGEAQAELLWSIRRLATAAIGIGAIIIALDLAELYEAMVLLLKTPLLTIQSVEFSLFNLMSAMIIVGSASLVSKIVRAVLNVRVYPAIGLEIGVAYAVNTLISYAIVIVGFFLVLVALGVNLSALTVVAASLSVGIGFGLQTLTENLISGFIILFGRAVRKGDYITVNQIYGRVEAVGARSVVVRTMDNYDLLIPSKELVGGTIINWTYRDSIVRLHVPVGVTYEADPREVERVLIAAASNHPKLLRHPSPEVWFVGFGDSAIDFELLAYFDCRTTVAERIKGELYYHIWDALAEAEIEIPFPQRDLHIRSAAVLPDIERRFRRAGSRRQSAPPPHEEEGGSRGEEPSPPGE